LPLIPPTPFSHKGRRGSLGILKLKTREGTQAPPKKPTPVKGAPLGYCVPWGGTPRLDEAKPACAGYCAVGGNPSARRDEARLRGLLCRGGEPLG
jgi:hypothetical protein